MTDVSARVGVPVIEVRIATSDDASSIAAVLWQSFIEYRSSYTEGGFSATTPDAEQTKVRMKEGPVWVALLDNEIVGTVSAVLEKESVYIRGMAVLPAARGHQIGDRLLAQIEFFAVSENLGRLFLSTTPFLHRAIALYQRHGFKRVDEGNHDLQGTPLFTMEKFLTDAMRKES